MDRQTICNHLTILSEELMPALGCTEPIAVAYAAAKAREVLGTFPETLQVHCSGNIIKNVKSVTVPNSNGLRGIDAAAILGCVGGYAPRQLEVLEDITPQHIQQTQDLLDTGFCQVQFASGVDKLYIRMEAQAGKESAQVVIQGHHTNITDIVKNGQTLFHHDFVHDSSATRKGRREELTVRSILEFADAVEPEELEPLLAQQIQCNMRIAQEGMDQRYGAGVARALLDDSASHSVYTLASAMAAAASEARMAGCSLPVVINSGSGNQGITVSVPVIVYAQSQHYSQRKLYRALAVSNLVSIHLKYYIGDLSAFCGAVTAACGAGAALAYLDGGDYSVVSDTISNTLACVSGIFCDGAKPSCAAKVNAALNAAFLAFRMARKHRAYNPGEGVVGQDVEQTIHGVGLIGREGMDETDQHILRVMLQS